MSASASFFYDGDNTIVAYVSGATPGNTYEFYGEDSFSTTDSVVAAATSFNMTITGFAALPGYPGTPYSVHVYDTTSGEWFGASVFVPGSEYPYQFPATWSYDGGSVVTVEFFAAGGITYGVFVYDYANSGASDTIVGSGTSVTMTVDFNPTVFPGAFIGQLTSVSFPNPTYSDRIFQQGVVGDGSPGNPSPSVSGFCERTWRFVVSDLDGSTLTVLDHLASERIVTPKLSEPLEVTGTVPSDNPEVNGTHTDGFPLVAEGVRQLYCFRRESDTVPYYTIRASTLILQVGDASRSDDARTRFTAWDPWQYLFYRPVLQSTLSGGTPGQLIDENGSLYPASVTADDIVLDILNTTISFSDPTAPSAAQSCFLDITSGTLQTCSPFTPDGWKIQQGTSVGQALQDLVSTGYLDIVMTPIYDLSRPGILCELNIFSQTSPGDGAGSYNYSAVFAWDKPGRSLVGVDDLFDGTQRANVVQFYNGQGGPPVSVQTDPVSIALYGEYEAQQFFPSQTEPVAVVAIAQEQLALRKNYKQTLTVNPAPERSPEPFVGYYIGDRVPVFASDNMRQEIAGWQRVYGIPVSIDDNGVETVRELLVGPVGGPPPVAAAALGGGVVGNTVAVESASRRPSGEGILISTDGVQA